MWEIRKGPMEGQKIQLVTQDELDRLPNGTILYSISGIRVVKGTDHIHEETRSGYLAYGILED